MSETTIVECPKCNDRKAVDHKQQLPPTVWCNCDGFTIMEVDHHNDSDKYENSSKPSNRAYPEGEAPGIEW